MKRWLIVLGLLMIVAIPSLSWGAGLLIVPDDFASIQEAINASSQGELIIIKEGTYSEFLTITKSLVLRAEGKVILVSPTTSFDPLISIKNTQKVGIEGIEVQYSLYGIEIQNSSQISFHNMIIEPNDLDYPSIAVVVKDSQVRISGSLTRGGDKVIALSGRSQAEIIGNTVSNGIIAGIFVGEQSRASIVNNTITHNILAGIALSDGGQAQIKRNTIESNEVDGISIFGKASASITWNLIQGNGGCGVWSEQGALARGWSNTISENGEGDICGATSDIS